MTMITATTMQPGKQYECEHVNNNGVFTSVKRGHYN